MIDIVYDVRRYRQKLADTIREGDNVVELGPHIGKSTEAYYNRVSRAVLVDKGIDCKEALEEFCKIHDKATFICGDVRKFDTMSDAVKKIKRCDVLALDMGGGRFPDTVFKVWATWSAILKPRDSIIRCRGLAEFIFRARVTDDTIKEDFDDAGWLADYGRSTPDKVKEQLEEFSIWVDI